MIDKFGPDFPPVFWTKVPAHELALRSPLKRYTSLNRDWATRSPLAQKNRMASQLTTQVSRKTSFFS